MTWQPSERVRDGALALVEQRRVRLVTGGSVPGAIILGDHDDLEVWFTSHGIVCHCYAGCEPTQHPACKHELAAMLCWGSYLGHDREPGDKGQWGARINVTSG